MSRTATTVTRPQQALQSYLDALLQEAAVELEESGVLDEFEAAVLEEQVRDARRVEAKPVLTRPLALAEAKPQVLPTIDLRLPEVPPQAEVVVPQPVVVATPDHTHAPAAIQAMKRGCHVYVEKPLVRTIWEARYFKAVAKENGVITQMGNHGSARDGTRRGIEILRAGLLGNVTEVHVWTNRPEISPGNTWGWKQPLKRPEGADPIPPEMSWDLWLGTSPAPS